MGGFSQNGKKRAKGCHSPSQSRYRSPAPPKGEPTHLQGQQKLNLGEQLPLPSGEVALRSNDGEVLVMMERMCIAV